VAREKITRLAKRAGIALKLTHRRESKTLTATQRVVASAPSCGASHRTSEGRPPNGTGWLKGILGDALHAVLCAAGFNARWLLRAIVRLDLEGLFFVLAALSLLRPPSQII
jgi:IS5 family transposase